MNATRTFGDTREDGFRFLCYEKRSGRYREKWCNPIRFEKVLNYQRNYWKTYRRKRHDRLGESQSPKA